MSGGAADHVRLARLSRDLAYYRAQALGAALGCSATPCQRAGRFEVAVPGGPLLIGTAQEILAWHREARTPERRQAAMREWLPSLGSLGGGEAG